jgi:hypothetical protein
VQYYLELDPKIPDVYFESSAFAGAGAYLDSVADKLKIKSIFELFSYAAQDDLCPPGYEEKETPWFDPQEGIDWLDVVIAHVRANPAAGCHRSAVLGRPVPSGYRSSTGLRSTGDLWHPAKYSGCPALSQPS